tara:strand:- start:6399 stop:6962 length:564 start_codon:yes stop_codon:yes gene_type:complete
MRLLKIVIGILIVLVILSMMRREKFTETFGFSGYKKPVNYVKLDDPRTDLSGYSQMKGDIDHDKMETFVIETNKELYRRLKFQTYIIETQSVKVYSDGKNTRYECTFTVTRNSGFAFGFVVVSTLEVVKGVTKVLSLRSQPLSDQAPDNIEVYTKGTAGKEFIDYKLVKEGAIPNINELDLIKNKLS